MARPELIIGNKNYSSWSMRPWLAMKQLGLDFTEVRVALFTGDYKQRLFGYSPVGRVPVYRDPPVLVWESLAILWHLASRYAHLLPEGPAEAAHAIAIATEMHAGFPNLRQAMPMNCRTTGRRVPVDGVLAADIARIQAIWNACRRNAPQPGPWLFGRFSVADAMYAPVVSRFHTYAVACPGPAGEYMEAVLADPYVREWFAAAHAEEEILDDYEVGRGA